MNDRNRDILKFPRHIGFLSLAFAASLGTGCAVNQSPGNGTCLHLNEATTGAAYWLYLPEGYNDPPPKGEPRPLHPLVMTFHGLKPFDNEHSQIREWQQEADRYGFVVCAPSLHVPAFSSPLPLEDPDNVRLKRDEGAILAIMDELYRTVDVDPTKVLSTSWSYGGYVAHYMANRYPERFSCIGVRQSNFCEKLLDVNNVPAYRDHPVAVFFTENDFAICRRESQEAAKWYVRQGFDLTYAVFEKKGHERTPGVAAEFFARTCGAEAKTPPIELAQMQVKILPVRANAAHQGGDGSTGSARDVGNKQGPEGRFTGISGQSANPGSRMVTPKRVPATKGMGSVQKRSATSGRAALHVRPVPMDKSTPLGDTGSSGQARENSPEDTGGIRIRVSATVGVAPMSVWYSAIVPKQLNAGSNVVWTDNGATISKGFNGQRVFREPGRHELIARITGADGQQYQVSRSITVMRRNAKN